VTLHRPALVDGQLLREVVHQLIGVARELPVLFPAHPRTRKALGAVELLDSAPGLTLLPPLGYLDFLGLVSQAAGVITDSGGIQEETTFLGVPCLTLRDNTERPITTTLGTNVLLGLSPERISEAPGLIEQVRARPATIPPLWDGHASERIVSVLSARQAGERAAA
jgi:UDP-N-acetylglucosamine 2-epimerase (non-hydrolysing)